MDPHGTCQGILVVDPDGLRQVLHRRIGYKRLSQAAQATFPYLQGVRATLMLTWGDGLPEASQGHIRLHLSLWITSQQPSHHAPQPPDVLTRPSKLSLQISLRAVRHCLGPDYAVETPASQATVSEPARSPLEPTLNPNERCHAQTCDPGPESEPDQARSATAPPAFASAPYPGSTGRTSSQALGAGTGSGSGSGSGTGSGAGSGSGTGSGAGYSRSLNACMPQSPFS